MHNLTIRDLKKSVDAHDRSGMYGTMQPTWKDAGCELLQNVTNMRLAEYLIGMSALIPMPQDYWPDNGVKWSVNVIKHRASKQMRTGIEREYGLEQMFDTKYVQPTSALAQAALGMTRKMMTGFQKVKDKIRTRNQGKIKRSETHNTDECAVLASAMASMLCEAEGIEFAGTPVAPKHYNEVFGRTDEAMWVEAMDKEVMKCFDMGTLEIVDTADIPPECSTMGTCFSFKVKCDSEGKLLEYQARANVNGTQQKPRSNGETFALRQHPNSV